METTFYLEVKMKVIIPHCMGKSRKNIRRKLKQDVGLNFVMDVYNV